MGFLLSPYTIYPSPYCHLILSTLPLLGFSLAVVSGRKNQPCVGNCSPGGVRFTIGDYGDMEEYSMTEGEEADVVHIVDPEETSFIEERVSHCIVCKLWTSDSYNVRTFKTTMMNLWKTRNGLEILDLDKKLYSIRSEMVARSISGNIGEFVEWDASDGSRWGKFLQLRIKLDMRRSLKRGSLFSAAHVMNTLFYRFSPDVEGDLEDDELDNFPYGQWMRASPLRSILVSKLAVCMPNKTIRKKLFSAHNEDKTTMWCRRCRISHHQCRRRVQLKKVDLSNLSSGGKEVQEELHTTGTKNTEGVEEYLLGSKENCLTQRRWKRRARGRNADPQTAVSTT
ncbi:hypothetical protein SESBI_03089 [Sesbania bispinosa]|nr:hypothetical protein SESBI_03089 [Sesbania bispinosa]